MVGLEKVTVGVGADVGHVAAHFVGVQKIQQDLDVIIVLVPAHHVEVNDVFKKPVLRFGRHYFAKSPVGAMNKHPPERPDFGRDIDAGGRWRGGLADRRRGRFDGEC